MEIEKTLHQIKTYLENESIALKEAVVLKDAELKTLKDEFELVKQSLEGTRQLVNKLLGEISKLQNDIEWYKRTYEQRSFLGTVWEKMFRRRSS